MSQNLGGSHVEILVDGEGLSDVQVVSILPGGTGIDIVAEIATKGGFAKEEAILFVEDSEQPIDLTVVILEEHAGKIHHVHWAKHIEVSVNYMGGRKEKRFSPSARVQTVLDWAVGKDGFNIDPAIAPDMELSIHGQTAALPKAAHIGRFAKHHRHELCFDLTRGVVPNGAL